MSIDAFLFMDTDASASEIKAHLLWTMHFQDQDDFRDLKQLLSEDTSVVIRRPEKEDRFLKSLGIVVTMFVGFFCQDKSRKVFEWKTTVVKSTLALLKSFHGDAFLLMYTDRPALLRKNGELKLLNKEQLWDMRYDPKVLPLIDLPYTFDIMKP